MSVLRSALVTTAMVAVMATTGCANRWQRPPEPDGNFCYVFGKKRESICTVQPVPSAAADLRAKQFVPDPDGLVVYVVRSRWSDGFMHVAVSADSSPAVQTVPESIVRLRLTPGRHNLTAAWEGKNVARTIEGKAGDVQFVELVGTVWAWRASFNWDASNAERARKRALESRLIADLAIR